MRVTWTARRSNQSILKEIHPEYSLEGLVLKLKLQFFGHLMQRTDLLEKTLVLRKIEGRRNKHVGERGLLGQCSYSVGYTNGVYMPIRNVSEPIQGNTSQ